MYNEQLKDNQFLINSICEQEICMLSTKYTRVIKPALIPG